MKFKSPHCTALALVLGLAALPAQAETFRAATWNAANSANDLFLTDFANLTREATNGEIDFEIYPGGSLLPANGTLEGLAQGVAHLANITATYIPSKMPVDFVTADMSFFAEDQLALAFAKTEVTFFNEQMQEELNDLDVVFATGFTIGIYYMICGFEADSIEDFQGRKIRASSDAQVEFVSLIGATSVNAPGNELYTGIQRGSIDCTTGTPRYLTDFFQMHEIAKSVYKIPLGSNANGGYYFNQDFWQDRTPEERRILLQALSRATARSMVEWAAEIDKAWQVAKEKNIPVIEPEPAAMEMLENFKEDFLASYASTSVEKRGIEDPTELINQMLAAMDKWETLLDEIDRTNVDEVTALLDREIFDKIDVNTYGVN